MGLKCFVDAQLGMDSILLNAMSVARGRGTVSFRPQWTESVHTNFSYYLD
jgi:hypothetical protein